ncbi:MAG: hypothetical protein GWN58_31265 [Anaerolineae bacterium]|nr:hypothetical protein [Anaerolineae bacterium]
MPRKISVIGHKNPDTDSIVSALAYAELLRLQGEQHVIAARHLPGNLVRKEDRTPIS